MDRLFNMDNKFFTVMGRVADLIMLNVVFLICCLPIVTIGASLTALHYVTLKMARNEESYIIRSFFKSFKQNFKQATVINLIMLAVAAILYMDLRIVGNIGGTMSQVLYIVFFAFGILYLMVFLYIYPVLAKFYNSIKNTFRNAFLMAIRHLPYTVLMAVITLLPAGVFFIKSFRIQSMIIMLLCLFGFALEAALELKKSRVKFHWVVLGIGSLKEELEKKREELGVQDCFEFIGARENPYAYMKNADVLVQSSRFEGKSVVLDEGKILCCPIVTTNYPTVYDQINEDEGVIVGMSGKEIADGIMKILKEPRRYSEYLSRHEYGNEKEIEGYYQLFDLQ